MTRPSLQFYPKDWRNNANLRRCSPAARGAWMDIMCTLHDSDSYGVVRWPLKDLANAAGVAMQLARELVDKGVLKGAEKGGECQAYVYTPRSGRRDGTPVTLVPVQPGPIWYSSRMVKDEYVRTIRGEGSRFGEGNGEPPDDSPKGGLGDGSSTSSSSSAPALNTATADAVAHPRPAADGRQLTLVEPAGKAPPADPPDCPHLAILALWAEVLPALPRHKPEQWKGARADHLRARWREQAVQRGWASADDGLAWFRRLFGYVGESRFLTGQVPSRDPEQGPFVCELEWLVKPGNFSKLIEGKYHRTAA